MELLETEHIAAVAATVALGALAVLAARLWPERRAAALCRGLALVILVAYATDHTVAIARGDWSARRYLPLHLTDAVTIVSAVALLTARALPVEVTYFWALTASLQAVLTPDLGEGFPDPYFWTYFVTHSGAVVAACVLVFGRGLRPRPGAVWRAFAATAPLAAPGPPPPPGAPALGGAAWGGGGGDGLAGATYPAPPRRGLALVLRRGRRRPD